MFHVNEFSAFPSMARDFPGGSVVKNLPASEGRSLDQEDPLEKEIATHCSFLAWRIPRTGEPGGLQAMGSRQSRTQLSG